MGVDWEAERVNRGENAIKKLAELEPEYKELKDYCAVLENENDELEEAFDKLRAENEKVTMANRHGAQQVIDLTRKLEEKDREIEKLTKIIRAVEVIMGGKILDD